jgi:hypothetical protein
MLGTTQHDKIIRKNQPPFFIAKSYEGPCRLVGKLVKSSFQCNKFQPVWSFCLDVGPVLVKTGQQFISLHDDSLPLQNCTIVQYFMVHAIHGVHAYQVSFPTHLSGHHLEVPRSSYCQNT